MLGGHWAVLQGIAWSRMMVASTPRLGWKAAVAQTLDGRHPCALCKKIEAGRKAEQQRSIPIIVAKLDLFHEVAPVSIPAPAAHERLPAADRFHPAVSHRPALPPPRIA
jgi:hypothetical protein